MWTTTAIVGSGITVGPVKLAVLGIWGEHVTLCINSDGEPLRINGTTRGDGHIVLKVRHRLWLGDGICLLVVCMKGGGVRLGIDADQKHRITVQKNVGALV